MLQFKLNDEQRELVEDNHNLIYTFMQKWNLSNDEVIDWYGIAAYGLCKAAYVYDESLGAFSTIAFLCMKSEAGKELRKNSKRVKTISLDESHKVGEPDEESAKILNTITDNISSESIVEAKDFLSQLCKILTDRQREVITRVIMGETLRDIAKELGVTHQRISIILAAARDKIIKHFGESYFF